MSIELISQEEQINKTKSQTPSAQLSMPNLKATSFTRSPQPIQPDSISPFYPFHNVCSDLF